MFANRSFHTLRQFSQSCLLSKSANPIIITQSHLKPIFIQHDDFRKELNDMIDSNPFVSTMCDITPQRREVLRKYQFDDTIVIDKKNRTLVTDLTWNTLEKHESFYPISTLGSAMLSTGLIVFGVPYGWVPIAVCGSLLTHKIINHGKSYHKLLMFYFSEKNKV